MNFTFDDRPVHALHVRHGVRRRLGMREPPEAEK